MSEILSGCAVRAAIQQDPMKRAAEISPCGKYRYTLWRSWAPIAHDSKTLARVMLNPSTADDAVDDNTIRKCIHYSKREGFQHLIVVNLYAFRSTDPAALWTMGAEDARGPDNIDHVIGAITQTEATVVAWGNPGGPKAPPYIANLGVGLLCLGTNQNGSPRHPLYLPKSTPMVRWPA
jgi:hypothetical protein